MANDSHKPAFPSQKDISQFLRDRWPKATDLSKAVTLSHNTIANWYRDDPSEIGAVNLLRVVLETGKIEDFEKWLRHYAKRLHEAHPRKSIPTTEPDAGKGARRAQG